jgi:N-hydroxyarylamine O-acetyltransferase
MPTPIDTPTYLARIGLTSTPEPTLAGLHTLQAAHMQSVPFENLDVLLGRPLQLDTPSLFDKIVTRRRGGYCFELNSLYATLLRTLGFDPVPMMARVWLRDPVDTPPRTHLVHRVRINDRDWLTDVGFGGMASHVPLPMPNAGETLDPTSDADGRLRIIADPVFGWRVQREQDNIWANQFSYEIAPAPRSDILIGNHWTETHPDSHFRHGIGVGLFNATGRTGLYNGILTCRGAEATTQTPIKGVEATLSILGETFGLNLNLSDDEYARLTALLD